MASFKAMTVAQLRKYLKDMGQNQSGNKPELLNRAQATDELFKSTPRVHSVDGNDGAILEKNAHVKSLNSWINIDDADVKDCPHVTDEALYFYLLYSQRGAKKQIKAKNFYNCQHVHSIRYHKKDEGQTEFYVTAKIIPSAASSDTKKYPDYTAWVDVSNSKTMPYVAAGYCTCPAGMEGACNHIAALLYALIDIYNVKKDGLDASTSSACKWKTPRKRKLSPTKAESMSSKKAKVASTRQPVSRVDVADLIVKLKAIRPNCGLVVMRDIKHSEPEILPSVPKPEFSIRDSVDLSSGLWQSTFDRFFENYHVAPASIVEIELKTRGQSHNALWNDFRKGCVTSSIFGKIVKRRKEIFPSSILKSVMGYNTHFITQHTQWGLSHERQAKLEYLRFQKPRHPHVKVNDCGLFLCSDAPYLAASPDGLVKCPHCQPSLGLIEIKCPSVRRHLTPQEACADMHFFCSLIKGSVTLKRDHVFYYQIQGQMGVTGRKWCDFVVWTTKGISVERILFDEKLWLSLKSELASFYRHFVVPELFSSRLLRQV